MKIKNLTLKSFVTFLAAITFMGCNPLKDLKENYCDQVQVKTDPEVMEAHADSIDVQIQGKISPDYLKKQTIIKYEPVITYGGESTTFEPFYVKEENAEPGDEGSKNYVATLNREEGGSFAHDVKVPYDPAMKESELKSSITFKIESDYDSLDQCAEADDPNKFTEGTITTALTVKARENIMIGGVGEAQQDKDLKPGESPESLGSDAFVPEQNTRKPAYGKVKPESKTVEGTIHFDINRSYIRQSEKEGEAMKRIRDFARTKKLVLNNINISSFASPDGELDFNANLTKDRASSTHDYLKKELKNLGHSSVHDSDFNKEASTKEDWNGFKRLVRESDLGNKSEILDIANSNMGLDEKESAIREMDVWEPYMVDTLLPKLRRSEISVKGFVKLRPLDTIRKIAEESSLDSLHKKELIRLAFHSKDIERKREIYEYYTERFPEDWIGYNNLGALLLYEGRYEEAKEAFQQYSERFPENPHIKNNLGIANRHMNEYKKARENYQFAQNKGLDVKNNLAILDIKVADYGASAGSFEADRCDYNVALAYTLNEEYDKALEKIDCITEKSADVFYLRAVIAARQGDKELMTTSLTRAVEKDGAVRERAKNDLEFRKFHGTEDFKNAIR